MHVFCNHSVCVGHLLSGVFHAKMSILMQWVISTNAGHSNIYPLCISIPKYIKSEAGLLCQKHMDILLVTA